MRFARRSISRGRTSSFISPPKRSFPTVASPTRTYDVNVLGTAALTQAVRDYAATGARAPRIVFTSSSEVYGRREPGEFPLTEALDLRPNNPYAASKAAAEAILLAESRCFRMDVVVARSFNHIGPRQSDRFVVAGMAAQLARAALEKTPLLVGNLEASRDFLDVRDVVAAYLLLAQRGERGEVYNVCSGSAVKIRDVLGELIRIAHVPVEVREDPTRMRPLDTPLFVGDNRKLRDATGWAPQLPLRQSLRDVYGIRSRDCGKSAGGFLRARHARFRRQGTPGFRFQKPRRAARHPRERYWPRSGSRAR